MKAFKKIGVVGAGGWGTSLACLLSENGVPVSLWCHCVDIAKEIQGSRVNSQFLPSIPIPQNVTATSLLDETIDADLVLFVTPSKFLRPVAEQARSAGCRPDTVWVNCTKGIEHDSGKLMTEILSETLGTEQVAVLSGPNHAVEVAKKIPAAAVIGCAIPLLSARLQEFLSLPTFRAYTSDDLRGIQLGGALKNIFAIGAGCSDGFQMGDNAKAALVTRSLAEMMRLGIAMGGQRETFYGLSGIGDLMVTCFSRHSRNRSFGERLGRGESPETIQASILTVAEGVPTALAAWQRARSLGVDTPIIDGIYSVLYQNQKPIDVMWKLLGRSPKPENT